MARSTSTTPGRVRWWVEGDIEAAASPLLEELRSDPDALLSSPRSVARARVGRKRFYRVEGGEGPALYVKVFTLAPGLPRLRYLMRPSKARREAAVARGVEQRGFAAARPVAVGEDRHLGLLRRSFSVIPEKPGRDLRALLRDPDLPSGRRRALVEAFGDLARRLHDAGIDQDDFSPNNFLVAPGDELVLLDFERCRIGATIGARRWRNLAKLHRHDLGVSRSDRLRFLRCYLGSEAGRAERRAAWEEIRPLFRRIRARDARRAARASLRSGRNVRREGADWIVPARRDVPVVRLVPGAADARQAWRRAHQLERLGLPALRPVRLGADWLELEDASAPDAARPEQAIARSRRRLEAFGHFTREPEWVLTKEGALLRDPLSFELDL